MFYIQPSCKRAAQRQADHILIFRGQLEDLLRRGVLDLSPEQHSRLNTHLDQSLHDLRERFDIDIGESQKRFSLGMHILATLGGLAFCAALYLFFFRIWGSLSVATQVILLVAGPTLGLPVIDFLSRKEKTAYYTSLISIVVIASFFLNLGVLGSLFNITSTPGALLGGGIFALILAYTYGLRLPLIVGLVALLVYGAGMVTAATGAFWEEFLQRPENLLIAGLVTLAASLPIRRHRHAEFSEIYRWIGLLLLFFSLEALTHGGHISYLPFRSDLITSAYRLIAFLTSGLTIMIGIRRGVLGMVNLGSGFFTLFLFDQLFSWWWDWMPKYLFCLILGLAAILLLAVFRKLRLCTQEPCS